jgi:hypothetical protein
MISIRNLLSSGESLLGGSGLETEDAPLSADSWGDDALIYLKFLVHVDHLRLSTPRRKTGWIHDFDFSSFMAGRGIDLCP